MGLEPTVSGVTGRCVNQLRYYPKRWWDHRDLNPEHPD